MTAGGEDDLDLDLDLDPNVPEPDEDEGLDPKDQGPAPEPDDDPEGDAPQMDAKPRSRADRRIETLANEAKRAREEAAELRRRVEEMASRRQQPTVDPELERRRYELMTPEERVEHRLAQAENQHRAVMQQMQFQMQDQSDRSNFLAAAASDPRRAKLAGQVEEIYKGFASKGQFISRETIYYHELGKLVASQGGKARDSAKKESAERVRRQTVPAGSSRGDVSPQRGRGKSFEDQYGDVSI